MNPKTQPRKACVHSPGPHRVSAEVLPHYEIHDHHRIQTGFDLTLLGLPSPRCAGDPGCQECERVHAVLRDMAVSVVPGAWRHLDAPFEAHFTIGPTPNGGPRSKWSSRCSRCDQTWETVDAAALREIPDMRRRLHEIGVREATQPAL
jgi:hypothetical protein